MDIINLKLSNLSEAKARVVFAIKNKNVVWENVIFVGVKKIEGLVLMCAISQREGDDCTLRLHVGPLRKSQYIAFYNEVILPIYNRDNNCIFMQDENALTESCWANQWQHLNPHVKFWTWPKFMKGDSPLNNVWTNMYNVEDFSDFASIFRCWDDFKENFDDFKHLYSIAKEKIKSLICNEILESESDE